MHKALPLELLSPAGGREQLEAAIHFGADAVYLSGVRWGMRARADNFSNDELCDAVSYAHAHGVAVHVTLNTLMYNDDLDDLPVYLEFLESCEVDALIVGDMGAMALAQKHAPNTALHVSTQASVANSEAARAYAQLGAQRIVLAREMSLEDIAQMHDALGGEIELECFVHGAMCMAVSGRCLLSSALVGPDRSASCGECTQPCRWTYSLVEETRPDAPMPLEVDERGSYILSANDLCMIEHLDELAQAGISSIKIEGRNKGAYYVAATTNAYRHVLDGEEPSVWMKELEATSHRPYSTGFFFGNPTQNPGTVEYDQDRTLVAVAEASDELADGGYLTQVVCRNKVETGDTLVVLRPGHAVAEFRFAGCEHFYPADDVWAEEPSMRANMERYRLRTPFPLSTGDMLCKPVG